MTTADTLADELTYLDDGRRVSFTLDETIYPLDAVYGAAYLFLERCYLFLDRPDNQKVEVRLKPRKPPEAGELEALAGEFANELLNQVLRQRISDSTSRIREYYMARAFFSAPAQASIDQLLAELDAEEMEEDDLEIAVPWEDGGA